MRVLVNRLPAMGRKTGVGHYTAELVQALRIQIGRQIEPFPEGLLEQLCRTGARVQPWLAGRRPAAGGDGQPAHRRLRGFALEQARRLKQVVLTRELQATLHRNRIDLYHEPNFIPLPVDAPIVATLHDLSVLSHPEWHPRDRVVHFEKHFERGLRRCQHFFAVSDFCREEIIQTLGIDPSRVTRTYNGARPGLRPMPSSQAAQVQKNLNLPPRYLLHVGTIEPRKNLLTLLKAYVKLPDALRRRWPLLLVGGWGWNTSAIAEFFHRQAKHRGVQHLGYLADEHLPALYNGARALLAPSLYEGFGMPAIEMMACGGAVLASTAGALVETVGAKAHLIDPLDEGGWHAALVRLLTDDDWWHHLRDGVETIARPFTWENCARDTLRVYRQLTSPAINAAA